MITLLKQFNETFTFCQEFSLQKLKTSSKSVDLRHFYF